MSENKINFDQITLIERETSTNDTVLLSVDLEDYYHGPFPNSQWEGLTPRLPVTVDILLELFSSLNASATWFTLGHVAKKHPDILTKIVKAGHEIACHTFNHQEIGEFSRDEFTNDLMLCKKTIKDACGYDIKGFRAPSFSVNEKTCWFFDVLHENGFKYDASICPIVTPLYGFEGAPFYSFQFGNGLVEFVLPTMNLGFRRMIFGGGVYLRVFPFWLMNRGIKQYFRKSPVLPTYVHPYDIDSKQDRVPFKFGWLLNQLMYYGRGSTIKKLKKLLLTYRHSNYITYVEKYI